MIRRRGLLIEGDQGALGGGGSLIERDQGSGGGGSLIEGD